MEIKEKNVGNVLTKSIIQAVLAKNKTIELILEFTFDKDYNFIRFYYSRIFLYNTKNDTIDTIRDFNDMVNFNFCPSDCESLLNELQSLLKGIFNENKLTLEVPYDEYNTYSDECSGYRYRVKYSFKKNLSLKKTEILDSFNNYKPVDELHYRVRSADGELWDDDYTDDDYMSYLNDIETLIKKRQLEYDVKMDEHTIHSIVRMLDDYGLIKDGVEF